MAFGLSGGGGDGDGYGDDCIVTNGVILQSFSRVIIVVVNVKTLKCDFINVITGS